MQICLQEKKKETFIRLDKFLSKVLVKLDEKYQHVINDDGTMVVKLNKALYGCIESARLWYDNLKSNLEKLGFIANPYDMCVFKKNIKDGKQVTLKDGYVNELIDSCDENIKGISKTPATSELFDIDKDSPLLQKEEKDWYHSYTANLLYLGKRVRPDILTTCSFLAGRVNNPTVQDLNKRHRLIRYVRYTENYGIVLEYSLQVIVDLPAATILEDNLSTISLVRNGKSNSERTRHIAIRFFFISDKINEKEIKIEYVSTIDQIADILTKPLQGEAFMKLRNMLLNWYEKYFFRI